MLKQLQRNLRDCCSRKELKKDAVSILSILSEILKGESDGY